MPSLAIPDSGLSLSSRQSSAKSDSMYADIFNLSLADSVIEDMIKCVRDKNSIQLSLGNDTKIIYGSQSLSFQSTLDQFPCDYFRTSLTPNPSSSASSSTQSHLVDNMPLPTCLWGGSHRRLVQQNIRTVKDGVTISQTGGTLAPSPPKDTTPMSISPNMSPLDGVDLALATLKSTLASEDARKKDNTTKQVKDTSTLPPPIQQRGPAKPMKDGNKARFLSQSNKNTLSGSAARSMPTSPALTGMSSPALGPTSVPLSQQQAEKVKAIRRPIIHKLALGPATEDDLSNLKRADATGLEFKQALEKVAELVDGKWKLKQRSFKDLDVFAYKRYTPEERQAAISNAIQVYDKLRLSNSEPEWDRLLPIEERGTGKCLSKLQAKIAIGAIQPVKPPKIKVQEAENPGRDTTVDDDEDDLFGERIPTAGPKSTSMARSHSNPPVTKQKKTSEKELQAKRLLTKGKQTKSASAKSSDKKSAGKDSSRIKSSEFVRDSDEEDDSYLLPSTSKGPVGIPQSKVNGVSSPQVKAATKTTRKIANDMDSKPIVNKKPLPKNARDDSDGMGSKSVVNKKPKVNNTSPQKSSPLASTPPTNASDFDDSSSSSLNSSLKRKSTDSSSDLPSSKRHQKSSSSSTNSSVTSSLGVVNGEDRGEAYWNGVRNNIQATKVFNAYYAKYKDLWTELNQSQNRDIQKVADLREMTDRLREMKANILSAARASS